jgi:hypothetical protein
MQLFAVLSATSQLAARQGLALKRVTDRHPTRSCLPRYRLVNAVDLDTPAVNAGSPYELTLHEILAHFTAQRSRKIAEPARQLLDQLQSRDCVETMQRYANGAVYIKSLHCTLPAAPAY